MSARATRMRYASAFVAMCCAAGTAFGAPPRALADDMPPPALPVIGTTHNSPFCTTVRDSVAPALFGLMRVDERIRTSRATLLGVAARPQDAAAARQPESNPDADLARLRLSDDVLKMARDLAVVQRIVDDPKRFSGGSRDEQRAQALRTQLKAAAERQAAALDLLDGMLETELEGQMRTEFDTKLAAAVGKPGSKAAAFGSPLAGSGLQLKEPIPVLDRRALLAGSTIPGHTSYDAVAAAVGEHQAAIARLEQTVTPLVVAAAHECGAPAKQP